MNSIFTTAGTATAIPIWFVNAANYAQVRDRLDAPARAFADAANFNPKPGRYLVLPGADGLGGVLFGIEAAGETTDPFLPGSLANQLPDGFTGLPTIHPMRGSLRSLLRSVPIVLRATARLKRTRSS